MSHYTSGLPKLDLEPFDPSPLYEAARSARLDSSHPAYARRRRPLSQLLLVALLPLAGLAGAAAYFFG
jgi:hypothetical protein